MRRDAQHSCLRYSGGLEGHLPSGPTEMSARCSAELRPAPPSALRHADPTRPLCVRVLDSTGDFPIGWLHMRLSPRRRICVECVGPQMMRVRNAETPAAEVDRRLTGHLQPRNTRKGFLGRRPGVTWFPERASFLARVLFYGLCARISGSGSPGSSDAAGAPGSSREDNPGLRTHVLGAPKVSAA